ncbi:ATP-binding cassette domain-containing protein [Rhizobium sp. AQ_MP]|uniref:ABC transporter ATP-binding protein n=1 Tax=Rhizobium sp. AQ_MP TaxID=2761536 RepID=UPI00163B2E5F|nr:ATP-binding cassette domain-containing protein [Rhizobium sp. AQ_MP]MBC2775254.1 ATP-binding cassette domain-containing protein [Rhizobium sp. AQ_MP]
MSNVTRPALECRDVTVRFGPTTALEDVSVAFAAGEIHAVVGQNGAGKTTFARTAAGLLQPSSGGVDVLGREVRPGDVGESRAAGVELVHQSFALPPSFSVAEVMEFGATGKGRIYSRGALAEKWRKHLADLDIQVDLHRKVADLPIETQQSIEIARALITEAKVLILDEPTAVLSPTGIDTLFARVRRLKSRGVTVILILHKIAEVLAIADTVTVLRGGRKVCGPLDGREVSGDELASLIVGDAPSKSQSANDGDRASAEAGVSGDAPHPVPVFAGAPALELRNVSTRPDREGVALDAVRLKIRPGEIVGVAGVEGNGQRTLVRAIAALVDLGEGTISLSGLDVTSKPLAARRNAGLRIIPFERNVEGLSLTSSLWENWSTRKLLQGSLLRFIRPSAVRTACDASLDGWGVHYRNSGQKAGSLSGGNAQKVILAREVDGDAKLIIAAQPTRGLDIGATAFVWQSLRAARDRGAAILLISSDLDEIFDISDRVVVMLSGRISGEFLPPYDIHAVGAAMTGTAMKATA